MVLDRLDDFFGPDATFVPSRWVARIHLGELDLWSLRPRSFLTLKTDDLRMTKRISGSP